MYRINVYRPSTGNLDTMYTALTELLSNLNSIDKATVVVGGDFNIDFNKHKSQGVLLMTKLNKRFSLEFFITDPTRPLYNESTLDQILTNCKIIKASGTIDTNISDHVPIFINIKKLKSTYQKTTFIGRTYRTFDKECFVAQLRNSGFDDIPVNVTPPDCCWDQLSKMIIDTLDQMAPLRTSTFRKDKPEWLTAELIETMKDRDQAMKMACRTKNIDDKRNARKLRNLANKSIKSAKSNYLLNKLELYHNGPKKFWQTINDILPHTKSSGINILSHQGVQMSDKEMSEEINYFFANVGAKLAS